MQLIVLSVIYSVYTHTHSLRVDSVAVFTLFSLIRPPLPLPPCSPPSLPPFIGVQPEMQTLVERRIYPFLLMVVMLLAILTFQIRQFKRLYEHIKNDKLVDPKNIGCDLTHWGERA